MLTPRTTVVLAHRGMRYGRSGQGRRSMFYERPTHLRNRHRLPADAYKVDGSAWHVTICTDERLDAPFADVVLGKHMLRFLEKGFHERDAVPHVLCLMPDHLHALVEVRSVGLEDLIARVKSFSTQIWWGRGGRGTLWQKSFYDHGIRGTHDFETTVTYLLNNPVKAGLAPDWESYPLIAGTIISPGHPSKAS